MNWSNNKLWVFSLPFLLLFLVVFLGFSDGSQKTRSYVHDRMISHDMPVGEIERRMVKAKPDIICPPCKTFHRHAVVNREFVDQHS